MLPVHPSEIRQKYSRLGAVLAGLYWLWPEKWLSSFEVTNSSMEADTVDGGSLNHRCPNLHFLNSRVLDLVTGLQDTCSLAAILVPCSISAILLAETCPCLAPLQCYMSCRAYVHTRLR